MTNTVIEIYTTECIAASKISSATAGLSGREGLASRRKFSVKYSLGMIPGTALDLIRSVILKRPISLDCRGSGFPKRVIPRQ
jgi:hypothetical protein